MPDMTKSSGMSFGSPQAALGFQLPPEWPACSTPHSDDASLYAPLGSDLISLPHLGAWRTLAYLDVGSAQILHVVRRYGALTPFAWTPAGEPLRVWQALVQDLSDIAGAWEMTTGKLREQLHVETAVKASWAVLDRILAGSRGHESAGMIDTSERRLRELQRSDLKERPIGGFSLARFMLIRDIRRGVHEPVTHADPNILIRDGHSVALACADMATFWRMQANHSIATRTEFRRCAFCGWWFTLNGRRSDRKYCSDYHRTAAAAGRAPPSWFWAEEV
jgi:hypothetical protein